MLQLRPGFDPVCFTGGPQIRQLWQEYEDCSSPEAALVKDFDKVRQGMRLCTWAACCLLTQSIATQLEMILQALEYQDRDAQLGEFFESVKGKFKTPTGLRIAEEIERRRQQ